MKSSRRTLAISIAVVLVAALLLPMSLEAQGNHNTNPIPLVLNRIISLLTDPNFGLAEIKSEVSDIEAKLDDPATGLGEIKSEVSDIEAKLDDPATGLGEIKSEVSDIQNNLTSIKGDVAMIKSTMLTRVVPRNYTGAVPQAFITSDSPFMVYACAFNSTVTNIDRMSLGLTGGVAVTTVIDLTSPAADHCLTVGGGSNQQAQVSAEQNDGTTFVVITVLTSPGAQVNISP
jgi:hypothetical protein